MAKVDVIKTSFTGGVFGDSLLGRTDIAQYENACAEAQNMLVRPYGPIISTPGTRYVNECKYSAANETNATVRLLDFVFNKTDAYVIEMGHKYFRFYTDRGLVVTSGTTAYEISHPYSESEIRDVQYAQLNDVIWMAHKNHPPQVLTRYAANSWTMAPYDFLGGPFMDDNASDITITATATAGSVTITLSATTSSLYFLASGATTGHVGTYWKIGDVVTTATTALQGYVEIRTVSSTTVAVGTVMSTLSTIAATTNFAEGAWSAVRGWPARVQFHEGRLYWARTDDEPQRVWGSHSFVYDQYALDEQTDSEGINIKLSSNQSNEIQWLASGNSLLAGTYGGVFVINGGAESSITPTNITAKQEVSFGTEAIQPKRIGAFFYYVQRFKKKVRELFYMWENNAYKATDKTILSPEITGNGIVEIAYQEVPDTILWCVTTDGTLATMTREIDQEVQGWTIQNTEGKYESVAVIPSQSFPNDEVWVVVQRIVNGRTKRYIEYFESIEPNVRQDKMVYLHSSLEFDAYDLTNASNSNCTISLSATAGTGIVLTCSESYFITSDETMRIRAINSSGSTIGEFYITSFATTKIVYGDIRYTFSSSTIAAGYWGKSVDAISGLDHLRFKTVKVLADGGLDKPDKVITTNGTIALAYNYFVVQIGLPYDQIVETLPFEAGSQRGTAQGKIQRINQVMFKVNRSYRGFSVGGTAALAERVEFREPTTLLGTPELLVSGVLSNINFRDDYQYGSHIYIFNDEPFPIEILSIMAMLDTQDKG